MTGPTHTHGDDRHKTETPTGTGDGGTDMNADAGEDDGGVETEDGGDVNDAQKPTTR